MKTDIVLAGVGGQGILSIATILGTAALDENLYIKQAEGHGMSQRGGDVQSNLRISSDPIASDLIPYGGADLIVSLEPMEALRYEPYLADNGWMVTNTLPFKNISNYPSDDELLKKLESVDNLVAFDMDEVAKKIGSPRSSNMVLLGAASPFIALSQEQIEKAIEKVFAAKGQKIVDSNIEAFREGLKYVKNQLNN